MSITVEQYLERHKEVLQKDILTFSQKNQLMIAAEECSELNKECIKALRGKPRREKMVEEMADELIMIKQLAIMFNITDEELISWIRYKIQRTYDEIEEYNKKTKGELNEV